MTRDDAVARDQPGEIGPADPTDLSRYPFVHVVEARFQDVDSLGHLNNVAIAAYYEDARVTFVREAVGATSSGALSKSDPWYVLLAELTLRYLAEAPYPGSYRVGIGVARLGRSSIIHHGGLFLDGRCVGTCRSVLVHAVGDGPAPLGDDVRAALEKVTFTAHASPKP